MTLPQHSRRLFRTSHNKTILHRILGNEAVSNQPKLCLGSSIRVNKNTSKFIHTKKDNFRVARKKNSSRLLKYCSALVQHQEPQSSGYEILSDCYGNRFVVPLDLLASLQKITPFSEPRILPRTELYRTAANFLVPQDCPFQGAIFQESSTFQDTAVNRDSSFVDSCFLDFILDEPILPFQPLRMVDSMPLSHDMAEEEVAAPVASNNLTTPQEVQSQLLHPVPQQESLPSQEVICTITEDDSQVPQIVLDFMLYLEVFDSEAYFDDQVDPLESGLDSEDSLTTVSEEEPSTPTQAPTVFSTVCANVPPQTLPQAPGIKRSWTPQSEKLLQCQRQRVPQRWSQSEIAFLRQLLQGHRKARKPSKLGKRSQSSQPIQAPPSPDWVAELEEELVAELKREEDWGATTVAVKGGIDDEMLSLFGCMSLGNSLAAPAAFIELPLVPTQ